MEEILGQVMLPPIKLKQFLLDYQKMFKKPFTIPPSDVNLQHVMNLADNDDRFKTIEESCSLDNLQQPDDPRISEFIPGFSETARHSAVNVPLEGQKLKTFKTLVKAKETKKNNSFHRSQESFSFVKTHPTEPDELLSKLPPGQELKLYIRIYRPTRATHIGRTLERPVFAEEFECLGSNMLTELRDKIHCVCNHKRFFDISEHPDAPLPSKDTDPGYFFITDTFYNDKRNPSNADYSETIRNWVKKAKGLSALKFKTALMEETQFIDLTVSLGFPQLYQHHGNCEHVFVISQLEVVTNPLRQLLSLSSYPHILTVSRYNHRTCNICGKLKYVFIVEGSNRQLHDPAYLCKQCFMSLHYVDGQKIGEFQAYRILDQQETAEDNLDETSNTMEEENDDNVENSDEEVDIIIKEETNLSME